MYSVFRGNHEITRTALTSESDATLATVSLCDSHLGVGARSMVVGTLSTHVTVPSTVLEPKEVVPWTISFNASVRELTRVLQVQLENGDRSSYLVSL